jgi:putative restriction endonuclease
VNNGLALCYQHHKLFDLGIFTLRNDQTILVSKLANGWSDDSHRIRSGSALVKVPEDEDERPAGEYLEWHRKNVFKE